MKMRRMLAGLIAGLLLTGMGTAQGGSLTQTQVSSLYVSIFGRASEGEGNTYWQFQGSMPVVADQMLETTAACTYFGNTLNDNQKFVEFIYENTLGKTYAQDPQGVAYWVGELSSGKSKGEVVATMVEAIMDSVYKGTDAQTRFMNRVNVCDYTAQNIQTVSNPDDLSEFQGYIAGVTSDTATVADAKSRVDAVDGTIVANDFENSSPESENMDSQRLEQMYAYISGNSKYDKLDAVLILRNGKIVSETYYNGHDRTYRSAVFSVTKAVTSLLAGIAEDTGLFRDTDAIMTYLADKNIVVQDERRDRIQVKHLLTMQAGISWMELNDVVPLKVAALNGEDTVAYMLALPMTAEPGTSYTYSSGLGNLMDGVVQKVSGKHLDTYADATLFKALGISSYTWEKDYHGTCLGGMGLHMTARDMAKLGQVALDSGFWQGEQIVSAAWMAKSTTLHVPGEGVGYAWRVDDMDTRFYIPGAGGQLIDIYPDGNLVVIYKTATDVYGFSTSTMAQDVDNLTEDYILAACN